MISPWGSATFPGPSTPGVSGRSGLQGRGGSHRPALALRLSASQMVPVGDLASDMLAEAPFLTQLTEPHRAQEPRAIVHSAKKAGCPTQTDGRQAWQAPGSGLCLQPPEKVEVKHLCSHLRKLLQHPASPGEGEGGTHSEASPMHELSPGLP